MCVFMGIFIDIRRKVPQSPHGLAATVVSRTDRVRGVFFMDSNLPTNGTRLRSFPSFFHDVVEMSRSRIQVLR